MVCDSITPVISNAQHGFVKGRSTDSNLVQFTNGVIGEFEDWWQVDGVYSHFSKAKGSYLTGRTQRVKLEDYLSELIQFPPGVPQGSHLGPIFFILDINGALDLFENVSVLG
jgi:hypothetical protein